MRRSMKNATTPSRQEPFASQRRAQGEHTAQLGALEAGTVSPLVRAKPPTRPATTPKLDAVPLLRGAYSPEHAAAYLDISRAEIYRLMASGALRGYRQGRLRRFLRSELDAFLSSLAAQSSDDGGGWDDAAS